jgi:hypothetical protein
MVNKKRSPKPGSANTESPKKKKKMESGLMAQSKSSPSNTGERPTTSNVDTDAAADGSGIDGVKGIGNLNGSRPYGESYQAQYDVVQPPRPAPQNRHQENPGRRSADDAITSTVCGEAAASTAQSAHDVDAKPAQTNRETAASATHPANEPTTSVAETTRDEAASNEQRPTMENTEDMLKPTRTKSTIGGTTDYYVLRCMSALQLLWLVASTPRHWLFEQASARPRVRPMLVSFLLPAPFTHRAMWLEGFTERVYVVSLLLIILCSSLSGTRWKPAVSAATIGATVSYIILVMFDVDRILAPAQCGLSLLLIGSFCDGGDGMMAARIVTSGTWLWGGLHKINPNFLTYYSHIADPMLSLALGWDFVGRHRILLHLLAALAESGAGLALFVASWALSSRSQLGSVEVLMVRASVVFLLSMHAMIIPRLIGSGWEINVLAWNVQYLFLAGQLWRPWWQRGDCPRSRKRHGGGKAVAASVAVFVFLPALLAVGLIDPYLGICLYTGNNQQLDMELPAGGTPPSSMTDLYRQWGFLEDTGGFQNAFIPVLTHDGRRVYRRWYTLLHAAATGGDVGYPARWSYMRIASAVCEQIRDADPSVVDEARFFLQLHYTGVTLFRSLWAMCALGTPPPPPPQLVREGCRAESDNDWRPIQLPTRVESGIVRWNTTRKVQISLTESTYLETPVDIYWVGSVEAETSLPELLHVGQVSGGEEPLQLNAWVGNYLLAAQGGDRDDVPYNGNPRDLCALEVWVVTQSESISQSFVLDYDRGNVDRRTVRGLQPCPVRRQVEFVNAENTSIDIFWMPPDGGSPVTIEVGVVPGDKRHIDSLEGHRFRASSTDGTTCRGNIEFMVTADQKGNRHMFCTEPGAPPAVDMGTQPIKQDDRSRDEL